MSYDLQEWSDRNMKRRGKVDISLDLSEDIDFKQLRLISINNKNQGRFYALNLTIAGKKYFVDFSYCFDYNEDHEDLGVGPVSFLKIGYYLDRKTGEPIKAHIWIKDLETGKRAAPEIYKSFIETLRKNVISHYEYNAEIFPDQNVMYYPGDKIEFAELQ